MSAIRYNFIAKSIIKRICEINEIDDRLFAGVYEVSRPQV